jgi:hypothetical protein
MRSCKGRIVRRASLHSPVVEWLEGRSLLSGMTLSSVLGLPLSGSPQRVGEVGPAMFGRVEGRATTGHPGVNHSAKAFGANSISGNVNVQVSAAAVRDEPEDEGLPLLTHADGRPSEAEDLAAGVGAGAAQKAGADIVGQALNPPSGDGSDPLDWVGPASDSSGEADEDRPARAPAVQGHGHVNGQIPGGDRPPQVSPEVQTRPRAVTAQDPRGGSGVELPRGPGSGGDRSVRPPSREASEGLAARVPAREAMMGGALLPNWETLEQDLRQFLAWIEDLQAGPSAHGEGVEWPTRFVVLAALMAAREAARRRGRRPPRLALEAGVADLISGPFPDSPGPWPLGPP